MHGKGVWTAAAAACYALIVLAHWQVAGLFPAWVGGRTALFKWAYGAAFLVLGIILIGAIARWRVPRSPVLWRPLMLSAGALAAAAEIWLMDRAGRVAMHIDIWMAALLGLALAAVAVRLAPMGMARRWLALDRRDAEESRPADAGRG